VVVIASDRLGRRRARRLAWRIRVGPHLVRGAGDRPEGFDCEVQPTGDQQTDDWPF